MGKRGEMFAPFPDLLQLRDIQARIRTSDKPRLRDPAFCGCRVGLFELLYIRLTDSPVADVPYSFGRLSKFSTQENGRFHIRKRKDFVWEQEDLGNFTFSGNQGSQVRCIFAL